MSTDRLVEQLDYEIARLQETRDALDGQIARFQMLREQLGERSDKTVFRPEDEPPSQFLQVAQFLVSKGNKPRSARAIVIATGLSRSSLSQILHRTHKDSFVSHAIPGYSRKKLWSLTDEAAKEAERQIRGGTPTLFGTEGDLADLSAADCCVKILKDHGNEPMNALSMAREALSRGYRGRAKGSEDEILLTTAKSFWAALGRDVRFQQERPLVFKLTEGIFGFPE